MSQNGANTASAGFTGVTRTAPQAESPIPAASKEHHIFRFICFS